MSRIVSGPLVTLHITASGHPMPSTVVTIAGGGVFSDPELSTAITTVTTNGTGDAQFYAPPGVYTFTATGSDTIESVEVLSPDLGDERALRYVKSGTATLVSGTVTVADTAVTANTEITLVHKTKGGTTGALFISAKTAATSFVISSTSSTDTSIVEYFILKY